MYNSDISSLGMLSRRSSDLSLGVCEVRVSKMRNQDEGLPSESRKINCVRLFVVIGLSLRGCVPPLSRMLTFIIGFWKREMFSLQRVYPLMVRKNEDLWIFRWVATQWIISLGFGRVDSWKSDWLSWIVNDFKYALRVVLKLVARRKFWDGCAFRGGWWFKSLVFMVELTLLIIKDLKNCFIGSLIYNICLRGSQR